MIAYLSKHSKDWHGNGCILLCLHETKVVLHTDVVFYHAFISYVDINTRDKYMYKSKDTTS